MTMYDDDLKGGWIIDRDYIYDPAYGGKPRVGTVGPSTYDGPTDPDTMPVRWRALDDDGKVYYGGRCNHAAIDEFGMSDPLHNFAMPDAGAVTLQIKQYGNSDRGKWVTV